MYSGLKIVEVGVSKMMVFIKISQNKTSISFSALCSNQVGSFLRVGMIKMAKGFIHDQPLERLHERPDDGDPLLFAIAANASTLIKNA